MMTEQLRVSIVAAPLAAIDPRALSQAWYSALHLAHERTPPAPRPDGRRDQAFVRRRTGTTQALATPNGVAATSQLAVNRSGDRLSDALVTGTTATRNSTTLASRIQTALARRAERSARAAFVVSDGSKRALILIQTHGGCTRLLAMCAPEHRDAVARALADVRASLHARGIAFESRIEAGVRCS